MAFQVVHLIEHAAQLGHWLGNPTEPPWLTPWAMAGRDALAVGGTAAAGSEVLHLVGNLIFLVALLAMAAVAPRAGSRSHQDLDRAVYLQGFHVVEHLLLTISFLIWGRSLGVTTLFGVATGVFGSSLRVWAHFLLNLVATYYAGRAGWALYRHGAIIPRGLAPAQTR